MLFLQLALLDWLGLGKPPRPEQGRAGRMLLLLHKQTIYNMVHSKRDTEVEFSKIPVVFTACDMLRYTEIKVDILSSIKMVNKLLH